MVKVKLKFPSLFELWKFKEKVHADHVFLLAGESILVCELTEPEIELAITTYRAKIVEKQTV